MARENEKVGNKETNIIIFTLCTDILLFNLTEDYIDQNIIQVQGKIIWSNNLENIKKQKNLNLYNFWNCSIYIHKNNDVHLIDFDNGFYEITDNIFLIRSNRFIIHDKLIADKENSFRCKFFKQNIINHREIINHLPSSWKQLIVENF